MLSPELSAYQRKSHGSGFGKNQIALLFLFVMSLLGGCAVSAQWLQSQEKNQHKELYHEGWYMQKRAPYLNEEIQIKFKSGNHRRGTLSTQSTDSFVVLKSANEEILYRISEIRQIVDPHTNKIIYP